MENKSIIKNLGQITALAMLVLKDSEQITKLEINTESLSQASAFVYMPILLAQKKPVPKVPILEELKEILICDLMTKPRFAQLKSSIKSLLHKWLNLLY